MDEYEDVVAHLNSLAMEVEAMRLDRLHPASIQAQNARSLLRRLDQKPNPIEAAFERGQVSGASPFDGSWPSSCDCGIDQPACVAPNCPTSER